MKLFKGIGLIEGDNCICRFIQETGRLDHDQNMLPLVLKHLKHGDWVIDCGAFIGDHTLAYSKAVGESGEVFAFEPSSSAHECLTHNMKDLKNVTCFKQGLGSETGTVSIKEVSDNAGMNYMVPGHGISVVSIDELELPRLDFIKIDCEGYELEVLKGAKATIDKFKPKMLIEINKMTLDRSGIKREDIFNWLTRAGYYFENIYKNNGLKEPQIDILCIHR